MNNSGTVLHSSSSMLTKVLFFAFTLIPSEPLNDYFVLKHLKLKKDTEISKRWLIPMQDTKVVQEGTGRATASHRGVLAPFGQTSL